MVSTGFLKTCTCAQLLRRPVWQHRHLQDARDMSGLWTTRPATGCRQPMDDPCAVARHGKHVPGRGRPVSVRTKGRSWDGQPFLRTLIELFERRGVSDNASNPAKLLPAILLPAHDNVAANQARHRAGMAHRQPLTSKPSATHQLTSFAPGPREGQTGSATSNALAEHLVNHGRSHLLSTCPSASPIGQRLAAMVLQALPCACVGRRARHS